VSETPTVATVIWAVAVLLPRLVGKVAVTITGPPTAPAAAWNVALVWPAGMVTLTGTLTVAAAAELSVIIVSLACAWLMATVRVALVPTVIVLAGGERVTPTG
jgi:hypothetical protein